MAHSRKLCSKKCGRTVDISKKFKTCCKSCALQKGYPTNHDPVCVVRYHEYKQLNSKTIPPNNDEQTTETKPWRCVLCNWSNKSIYNKCKMCNKERPNKKRKRDICPDAEASPFHACSQKCFDRWGVHVDNTAPPTKRQKMDTSNSNNDTDSTWKCSLCTFINPGMSLQCNVCQTEKDAHDEVVLKRLKSQRDELERNKNTSNDSFDIAKDNNISPEIEILSKQDENNKNKQQERKKCMKEEMDSDDDVEETKQNDIDDKLSEHDSDDDVALEMFKNGLTPNVVQSHENTENNNDSFDVDPTMDLLLHRGRAPSKYMTFNRNKHNLTKTKNSDKNKNKSSDLLFALSVSDYLEQSGFTYIVNDSEDRYIADIVAQSALSEEEYWAGHNAANIIPWADPGDDIDNLINGFDHGTISSQFKKTKKANMIKNANGLSGDMNDDEIDEDSVERVNIQREFQYAMQTGKIVRCRLIRRRQWMDDDDGDAQFRICESQFMRSCNRVGMSSNGMQRTLKEVVYVINPELIKKFQAKKRKMKRRLGSGGANTILAWHGTPSTNIDSIVENNFNLSHLSKNSGDTGWYGAGIYFSEYANISQSYGDGLLLCKIMLGKTYKMKSIKVGCEQKNGYDSHMAGGSGKYGTEIVIFDMDQILPCYIVKY